MKVMISLLILIQSTSAFAAPITFQREYVYQASEIDSKISCRAIALEQVKRLLLEELGTFLESNTEVRNFQLTKDQVTTLSAGVVKTEIVEEKWDGQKYYLKARIIADPDEVAKVIDILRKDSQKTKEMELIREKAGELLREVERLRTQLSLAKKVPRTVEDILGPRPQDAKGRQEQYSKAINELSAVDWFEKGIALGNARNISEAIESFNRAITLNPKFAEAYLMRGMCYKERDYHASQERRDYLNQAISDFTKAMDINPTGPFGGIPKEQVFYRRGEIYRELARDRHRGEKPDPLAEMDYQKAIKDFSEVIKSSDLAWKQLGYMNRSWANEMLGNFDQAINDSTEQIKLETAPSMLSRNYVVRSQIYEKMGNFQQAFNDLNKAIELLPNQYNYSDRGKLHLKAGNPKQAIVDFSKAIELDPERAYSYEERGNAYINLGNYQKAINDFNVAIRIRPEEQYLYVGRGEAYKRMGLYQKAINDYDKAIEINPRYASTAYCGRAEVYLKMGYQKQAIADFDRAVEIWTGSGDYSQAYYGRGLAQIKLGNNKQALEDIKTAARGGFKEAQDFLKTKRIKW
jgi:tetratricopeptide (TPR) repeat protein